MGNNRPRPRYQSRDRKGRVFSHSGQDRHGKSQILSHPPRPRVRRDSPLVDSDEVNPASGKSKRERSTNPSTRIHSLRNLLARGGLPATVRQEKERELASLLFDQHKAKLARVHKDNLERYHFVRFIERKKAQRTLKKLAATRAREEATMDRASLRELDRLTHEAEVDEKYCVYAPLGEKYISLYVEEDKKRTKRRAKMNPKAFRIMTQEQQDELRDLEDEHNNLMFNATGTKPPLWYEIEEYMAQGRTDLLDALRVRQPAKSKSLELTIGGGKAEAAERAANPQSQPSDPGALRPDWMDDGGIIDPADLDSDEDEDMSDGGFFVR